MPRLSLFLHLPALVALCFHIAAVLALPKPATLEDRALLPPYSLPQNDLLNSIARGLGITTKQLGFLYGPPVAGGPFFPTGVLGIARAAADQVLIQVDEAPILAAVAVDSGESVLSAPDYNGLQTLDDYTLLYDGHWKTLLPEGPVPGMLTNYTQDLLFSMERLSLSPYQIRRLNPSSDILQFVIPDSVSKSITGMTLRQLLQTGRLFYADYRDQAKLTPNPGRYSANVDAYFYIDPASGDFLPLAIRSNVGAGLIYTPKDSPNDWLLAKMMFNVNDFWFAQWNHLAATHEVVQITYLAAIRALSDSHPVMAMLNRIMYEVYAIQPLAETLLFLPGAAVDQVFAFSGSSAQSYTTNRYQNGGAGRFKSNYFYTDLQSRGLINANFGPPLKDFPFFEDGSIIYNAIRAFMTSFVNSYYFRDSDVTNDKEMQAWVKEAQGPAKAIDFPSITTKSGLIDALSHMVRRPSLDIVRSSLLTGNSSRLISCQQRITRSTRTNY
jgi:arachidonate 15-lipoxygenase (second type) / 8-lipoxygenase (S-type)